MDFIGGRLLLSSVLRAAVLDTETQQVWTVGQKPRDGIFGGCFGHFSDRSVCTLFTGRPGSRVWRANAATGAVEATLNFKALLDCPPSTFLGVPPPKMPPESRGPQSCAFASLHTASIARASPSVLLALTSDSVLLTDPADAKLLAWYDMSSTPILSSCVVGSDVFILHVDQSTVTQLELMQTPGSAAFLTAEGHHNEAAQLLIDFASVAPDVETFCRAVPKSLLQQITEGLLSGSPLDAERQALGFGNLVSSTEAIYRAIEEARLSEIEAERISTEMQSIENGGIVIVKNPDGSAPMSRTLSRAPSPAEFSFTKARDTNEAILGDQNASAPIGYEIALSVSGDQKSIPTRVFEETPIRVSSPTDNVINDVSTSSTSLATGSISIPSDDSESFAAARLSTGIVTEKRSFSKDKDKKKGKRKKSIIPSISAGEVAPEEESESAADKLLRALDKVGGGESTPIVSQSDVSQQLSIAILEPRTSLMLLEPLAVSNEDVVVPQLVSPECNIAVTSSCGAEVDELNLDVQVSLVESSVLSKVPPETSIKDHSRVTVAEKLEVLAIVPKKKKEKREKRSKEEKEEKKKKRKSSLREPGTTEAIALVSPLESVDSEPKDQNTMAIAPTADLRRDTNVELKKDELVIVNKPETRSSSSGAAVVAANDIIQECITRTTNVISPTDVASADMDMGATSNDSHNTPTAETGFGTHNIRGTNETMLPVDVSEAGRGDERVRGEADLAIEVADKGKVARMIEVETQQATTAEAAAAETVGAEAAAAEAAAAEAAEAAEENQGLIIVAELCQVAHQVLHDSGPLVTGKTWNDAGTEMLEVWLAAASHKAVSHFKRLKAELPTEDVEAVEAVVLMCFVNCVYASHTGPEEMLEFLLPCCNLDKLFALCNDRRMAGSLDIIWHYRLVNDPAASISMNELDAQIAARVDPAEIGRMLEVGPCGTVRTGLQRFFEYDASECLKLCISKYPELQPWNVTEFFPIGAANERIYYHGLLQMHRKARQSSGLVRYWVDLLLQDGMPPCEALFRPGTGSGMMAEPRQGSHLLQWHHGASIMQVLSNGSDFSFDRKELANLFRERGFWQAEAAALIGTEGAASRLLTLHLHTGDLKAASSYFPSTPDGWDQVLRLFAQRDWNDWAPITFDSIATEMADQIGAAEALDLLGGDPLFRKWRVPLALHLKFVRARRESNRRLESSRELLEHINSYLWSKRPTADLSPLSEMIENELFCSPTSMQPFEPKPLISGDTPLRKLVLGKEREHWGARIDLTGHCRFCHEIILEGSAVVIYPCCGCAFHEPCTKGLKCPLCTTRGF